MATLYQRFDVVCAICRRINIKDKEKYVVVRRENVDTYLIVREKDVIDFSDIVLYPSGGE